MSKYGRDSSVTEMLNKMDFVIMPVLNVDGYVFTWNKVQVIARNQFILTLSLPEKMMEVCKVTLTFVSVDQILWCDHSNKSSLPVVLSVFQNFPKWNLDIWSDLLFAKFGSERTAPNLHKGKAQVQVSLMNRCSLISPRIQHKVVLLVALYSP